MESRSGEWSRHGSTVTPFLVRYCRIRRGWWSCVLSWWSSFQTSNNESVYSRQLLTERPCTLSCYYYDFLEWSRYELSWPWHRSARCSLLTAKPWASNTGAGFSQSIWFSQTSHHSILPLTPPELCEIPDQAARYNISVI